MMLPIALAVAREVGSPFPAEALPPGQPPSEAGRQFGMALMLGIPL
ncbi:MAG: hypothetical protein V3U98_01495 [Acidobacteriota bacterium]